MKKIFATLSLSALVLALFTLPTLAEGGDAGTWSGEVIDLACYIANGDQGRGPDHAGCAKSCVKNGQPMGLLTDDGTLVLLAADHGDGSPYEALKDLAGQKAEVSGVVAERDGMKIVTVKGSKAGG